MPSRAVMGRIFLSVITRGGSSTMRKEAPRNRKLHSL